MAEYIFGTHADALYNAEALKTKRWPSAVAGSVLHVQCAFVYAQAQPYVNAAPVFSLPSIVPPAQQGIIFSYISASPQVPPQLDARISNSLISPIVETPVAIFISIPPQIEDRPTTTIRPAQRAGQTPPIIPSLYGAPPQFDYTLQAQISRSVIGPSIPLRSYFASPQLVDLTQQAQFQKAQPPIVLILGPTVYPNIPVPAQIDFNVNGTKIWTSSTFTTAKGTVMPNVVGMNYYEALQVLQNAGVYVPTPVFNFNATSISVQWAITSYPGGIVTAQSIAAGLTFKPNQPLTLTISTFPFGAMIDSPPDWKQ